MIHSFNSNNLHSKSIWRNLRMRNEKQYMGISQCKLHTRLFTKLAAISSPSFSVCLFVKTTVVMVANSCRSYTNYYIYFSENISTMKAQKCWSFSLKVWVAMASLHSTVIECIIPSFITSQFDSACHCQSSTATTQQQAWQAKSTILQCLAWSLGWVYVRYIMIINDTPVSASELTFHMTWNLHV